jgi:hypothetical protein
MNMADVDFYLLCSRSGCRRHHGRITANHSGASGRFPQASIQKAAVAHEKLAHHPAGPTANYKPACGVYT